MIQGYRRVKIYCPDCGWYKEVEMEGPADEEYAPDLPKAEYFAEGDIRTHCGEMRVFHNQTCHPFLIPDEGTVMRFEPRVGDAGEFVI